MKKKAFVETTARVIFLICAAVAILAVCAITFYMLIKGLPALKEVGALDLLFGNVWKPTAETPSYGIWYIILASLVGTCAAVLIGVPVGLLTAVFLAEMAGKKLAVLVGSAVELLAAIPSVIYGLLGMMILNPLMFKLEKLIYSGDSAHQFTGGANMLSAIIVLAIMILPTVISVSTSSLKAVPDSLRAASLALGATKEQTIFKSVIPETNCQQFFNADFFLFTSKPYFFLVFCPLRAILFREVTNCDFTKYTKKEGCEMDNNTTEIVSAGTPSEIIEVTALSVQDMD